MWQHSSAGLVRPGRVLAYGTVACLVALVSLSSNANIVSAVRINPVIAPYVERTKQYLEDAKEANAAAEHYAKLTAEAIPSVVAATSAATTAELDRIKVKPWAAAAWSVEKMLDNQKPAQAAAAAAKAQVPFQNVALAYESHLLQYDEAAQLYAKQVQDDVNTAHQLQAYSNQYRQEGGEQNLEIAANYHEQAVNVMNQAEAREGMAKDYNYMALKLKAAIPMAQNEGRQAAAHAAFGVDPGNGVPAEEVYKWTLLKPYPDEPPWPEAPTHPPAPTPCPPGYGPER